MKGTSQSRRVKWVAGILVVATPAVAFAYVDPGTGAYVVQCVLALVGMVTFYATRPIRFLRILFARRSKSRSTGPISATAQPDQVTNSHHRLE